MAFMPYIHFGGTDMMMMRYAEAPPDAGGAASDLVMHAQFNAGGDAFYPPLLVGGRPAW